MILRFDDTNPTKEKEEFVDSIMEDLKDLGVNFDKLSYTSDYFDKILELGRLLIGKGLAFVDNTPKDQMQDERKKCIESKNRNLSVEENHKIFCQMIEGKADDYALRAKIDMKSTNGTLRDPVLFRTIKTPHHRTGKKYSLYPTYDFACPIVDSLEGVTHVLRTNEYADRIPQFKWILKALDLPELEIYEYSRLNLEYTVLSKRKLQWFVDTKRVSGWDDPRFPTYRGVLRKGIRKETLIEFMLEQGPSKNTNLMEWDKLWATNKRIIDPMCPRFAAVSVEKASTVEIINGPEKPEAFAVAASPTNAALGTRPYWKTKNILLEFQDAEEIQVDEKVTFMNWGNFLIKSKELQPDGSYKLTALYLEDDKDFKKTRKYTWIAKVFHYHKLGC
jgi:glutamyl-tRNA synthetase